MTDRLMPTISYLISGGILTIAVGLQCWIAKRKRGHHPAPAGMDLLGKTLFDCAPKSSAVPMFGLGLWFLVCLTTDVVFPQLPNRYAGWDVVDTSLQAILFITYVLLAPLLVWCYMSVARDVREANQLSQAGVNYRSVTNVVWWTVSCLAGFGFQYSTIRIQVGSCSSTPPWLWVLSRPTTCESVLNLNWQGAVHAALRGLDAIMALGLAATVVMVAVNLRTLGGNTVLETHGGWQTRDGIIQCKAPLRKLSLHLVIAGTVAVAIATLHYMTIEIHRQLLTNEEASSVRFAQFVESTWLIWGVISVVWAGLTVRIIYGVYRRACTELRHSEAEAIANRAGLLPSALREEVKNEQGEPKQTKHGRARRAERQLKEYWEDHRRIRRYYMENAQPYPLPSWLKLKLPSYIRAFFNNIIAGLFVSFLFVGGTNFSGTPMAWLLKQILALFLPSGAPIPCGAFCPN